MNTWMTGIMIVLTCFITAVEIVCLEGNTIPMAGFVYFLGLGLLSRGAALPRVMSLKSRVGPARVELVVHGKSPWSLGRLLRGSHCRPLSPGLVEKQASVIERERLIGH